MKLLRLVSCLVALGSMLTDPFLDSSNGAIRLPMPFASIDTTNCVANSPTVWFAATNGNDSNDGKKSEEHTSELQSLRHLVCRLLLEKKKKVHDLDRRLHTTPAATSDGERH